eukprot:GHRR01015294.1.p1 GENE.GHRR01015294.1~~GHRR01015294.1.p1  ORF type:complete len:152 (+),score=7.07 GHRR01015294.1:404-859(+)
MASINPCLGSRAHYGSSRSCAPRSRAAPLQRQAAAKAYTCSLQFHLTSWDAPQYSNLALQQAVPSLSQPCSGAPKRQVIRMGNKSTGGPFSPMVVIVRKMMGDKEFNKLRGKAISVHSQGEAIITSWCVVGYTPSSCMMAGQHCALSLPAW